jgi:hypothetical protein
MSEEQAKPGGHVSAFKAFADMFVKMQEHEAKTKAEPISEEQAKAAIISILNGDVRLLSPHETLLALYKAKAEAIALAKPEPKPETWRDRPPLL